MTSFLPNLRIFIDLENVPWAKPDVCPEHFDQISLLIGPKQPKLNIEWTQLSIDHPGKIQLIRITESAPDALDFILAYHIGRAAVQHPAATYRILSNDKGFDPLVRHLKNSGINASRQTIDALQKTTVASPPATLTLLPRPADLCEEARQFLTKLAASRPKKRATLSSSLRAKFRNQDLPDDSITTLINCLIQSRYLKIDSKDAITYAA